MPEAYTYDVSRSVLDGVPEHRAGATVAVSTGYYSYS